MFSFLPIILYFWCIHNSKNTLKNASKWYILTKSTFLPVHKTLCLTQITIMNRNKVNIKVDGIIKFMWRDVWAVLILSCCLSCLVLYLHLFSRIYPSWLADCMGQGKLSTHILRLHSRSPREDGRNTWLATFYPSWFADFF